MKINKIARSLDRSERILLFAAILSIVGAGLLWILYLLFGHSLIESIYNGESFDFLNQLIQYQHKKPLDHYLQLADQALPTLIFRGLFIEGVVLISLHLFYRLIFTEKRIKPVYPILLGILFISFTYVLNTGFRIYSNHGFYRVSIAYQILNGSMPPDDPLFAGEIIRAPWGYPWLIAVLTQMFQVSPFWITTWINLFCLACSMYLVYVISFQFSQDNKSAIFSMIVAFFAATPISMFLAEWIGKPFDFYSPFTIGIPRKI